MLRQFNRQARLYPTKEQQILLVRNFGCARFIWNFCTEHLYNILESNKDKPKEDWSKLPSGFDLINLVNRKKREDEKFIWLKDCDSRITQSTCQFFFNSTRRFLKDCKNGVGKPHFKRKDDNQSYTTIPPKGLRVKDGKIKLPKIGWIEFRCSKDYIPDGVYKRATIKFDGDIYHITLLFEQDVEELPYSNESVGIDLGIKTTITTSDGEQFNFKLSKHEYRRLKLSDRRLSRTKKDSKRREKAKLRRKRRYRKLRNRKKDFIHKTTTQLVKRYQTISIEDLNVSGMMKNHHLARKIAENNFFEIKQCLSYKCEWYGRRLIVVDRWYPSSQLCSCCGTQVKEMKDLKKRMFICPHCGLELDRDVNAARNLSTAGDAETGAMNRLYARGDFTNINNGKPSFPFVGGSLKREDRKSNTTLNILGW